ncbi:hypothetical protein JAAARDRAFT_47344 [Jaapia argillacea MUCL 33604]|uniref:Uncharacterized protein n=1 Tax=Jaapia argillacea MUCL 33604 TaxID=933084 RepID=A0A067PU09_9AGAM|nr:hypothetical protein JAAARDRAFT_47344 [Jaapia argillacea MUCL 33604]
MPADLEKWIEHSLLKLAYMSLKSNDIFFGAELLLEKIHVLDHGRCIQTRSFAEQRQSLFNVHWWLTRRHYELNRQNESGRWWFCERKGSLAIVYIIEEVAADKIATKAARNQSEENSTNRLPTPPTQPITSPGFSEPNTFRSSTCSVCQVNLGNDESGPEGAVFGINLPKPSSPTPSPNSSASTSSQPNDVEPQK